MKDVDRRRDDDDHEDDRNGDDRKGNSAHMILKSGILLTKMPR